MSRQIIDNTENFVRQYLQGAEAGHNWWHIHRVRETALLIYSTEKQGDPFIIEMAALLHETGDYKIKTGNEDGLSKFLDSLDLDRLTAGKILYIVKHISFRDTYGPAYKHNIELDIVQDADRLDAIGAIGIARAFNYGGSRGLEIFNPDEVARNYENTAAYVSSSSCTINHFHEKLLRLRDMMNTETGRKLAEPRHRFMEVFLQQFIKEWEGAAARHK